MAVNPMLNTGAAAIARGMKGLESVARVAPYVLGAILGVMVGGRWLPSAELERRIAGG